MKVMFIVYHDIRNEARSQEILECARKLGDEIIFVSYSKPVDVSGIKCVLTGCGKKKYFTFIMEAIKAIKTDNPQIVILHDNYTSVILRWLYKHNKNIIVVYDSSELYIDRKYESLKMKIASHMDYFEKKYLRYADIVIAANIERANIMKEYFQLNETPIVFDNVHKIDDNYDVSKCNKKYGYLFSEDTFCIVYAGGIGRQRMTFELANAVGNLGKHYRLIVIGESSQTDKEQFSLMLAKKEISNVFYLGFIPRNEWRFLLNRASASVSAFAQDTVNNINCASGKVYESIFEGKPIITTENPPLKRICKDYGLGVSGNNFEESIIELEKNYNKYCTNVKKYANSMQNNKKIDILVKEINQKISKLI